VYFQVANAFELYDMHGNITEWCYSMYWPYKGGPQQIGNRDGYWLEYKNYRAVRGGAWIASAHGCHSANRGNAAIEHGLGMLGLRVACSRQ
jgi:formylglycine-generating enzyme required for sulfatase activity